MRQSYADVRLVSSVRVVRAVGDLKEEEIRVIRVIRGLKVVIRVIRVLKKAEIREIRVIRGLKEGMRGDPWLKLTASPHRGYSGSRVSGRIPSAERAEPT